MSLLKNTKKALSADLLVKALIAVVVLFMISMIFFIGEDSQFAQIKKLIPSFSSEIKPDGYSNADYSFASAEEKSTIVYYELVKGIESLDKDPAQNCFYFLPPTLPYDGLDDNLWIRIDSGKATNGKTYIYLEAPIAKIEDSIEKGEFYSQTAGIKIRSELETNICVILGSSAEEFVKTIKKDKDIQHLDRFQPSVGYEQVDQLILEHNDIYLDGYQVDARFKTENYEFGLVKIADNSICLLITESTLRNSCRKASTNFNIGSLRKSLYIAFPSASSLFGALVNKLDSSGGNFLATDCFETKEIPAYEEQFITWSSEYNKCLSYQDESTLNNRGEEGKEPTT